MSNDMASDLDKLKQAFSSLTGTFSSVEDILAAFGFNTLPTAQRYGIVFGICVFTLTITTVMVLLIFGGTFARIAEQTKGGGETVKDAVHVRKSRPLLFERLLETRERMLKENYPPPPKRTQTTPLTEMLLNVPYNNVADLVPEDDPKGKKQATKRQIPQGYEENYKKAYLTCQDKPGGT